MEKLSINIYYLNCCWACSSIWNSSEHHILWYLTWEQFFSVGIKIRGYLTWVALKRSVSSKASQCVFFSTSGLSLRGQITYTPLSLDTYNIGDVLLHRLNTGFFPERRVEGRFLWAVSLSSMTSLAWFKLLNLNLLDLTCLTWTCLTKTFLISLSWLDLGKLLTWLAKPTCFTWLAKLTCLTDLFNWLALLTCFTDLLYWLSLLDLLNWLALLTCFTDFLYWLALLTFFTWLALLKNFT